MKRRLAVSFLAAALVLACKTEQPPALMMRSDAGVCEQSKGVPVLELPADGSYRLNNESITRAQLEQRLLTSESLPLGPHTGIAKGPLTKSDRFVIVRFDSTRGRELSWIIPEVDRIGGEVVSPPPCSTEADPAKKS